MNRRERRARGKGSQLLAEATGLHRAGRIAEAATLYRRILAEEPRHADALHLLGVALFQSGRAAEAAEQIGRAIAVQPAIADFHNHLGAALIAAGKPRDALGALERARALAPGSPEIHLNLGNAHRECGDLARAEAEYRRSVELAPALASAHMNLGNTLRNRGAVEEGIAALKRATELEPRYADAHMNLGIALKDIGRADEAVEAYRRALALLPQSAVKDIAATHYNLSIALLVGGAFEDGWREFEWRLDPDAGAATPRPHAQPRWDGATLGAKKLLVWGEQGVGDELIYGTMLPDLIAAGMSVVLECDPRLAPLFARGLPGVEIVARRNPSDPRLQRDDIGAQIAVGSLGRFYRKDWASFANGRRPIAADPARTDALAARYRAKAAGRKVVGISWRSGNARIGRWKSSPLEAWAPVFALENAFFVDLQYGDTGADRARVRELFGVDLHRDDDIDALTDLDGFAAQVASVDRVLSVSNTTVHFAGALAKPATTLLHQGALWYWFRGREDTPWYPGMRLLRQGPDADWSDVFARAASALAKDLEKA